MRTATAILSPRKSTNVRFSFMTAARVAHGLLGRLAPARAARRFRDIMLTPKRPADVDAADLLRRDNAVRVPYASRWLSVWSFGSGPTVLLAHGWSGYAAQFDAWIEPLVAAGYRVVLFDAPAHGRSGGRRTNLMDMGGAIQHVAGLFGPVHAVVAHSFGAPATLFALQHGLKVERLVLVASPLSLTLWSVFLAKLLGFPMSVRARMQQTMERKLEFGWDEAETDRALAALAAERKLDVLLMHDRRDREVPFTAAERIAAAVPAARFFVTDGNGHLRILRNAKVIAEAVGFVGGAGPTRRGAQDAALHAA
jgi:pimeloyl-ACP methyl ester carboxylesterase